MKEIQPKQNNKEDLSGVNPSRILDKIYFTICQYNRAKDVWGNLGSLTVSEQFRRIKRIGISIA